jgi:hypothetical protein
VPRPPVTTVRYVLRAEGYTLTRGTYAGPRRGGLDPGMPGSSTVVRVQGAAGVGAHPGRGGAGRSTAVGGREPELAALGPVV